MQTYSPYAAPAPNILTSDVDDESIIETVAGWVWMLIVSAAAIVALVVLVFAAVFVYRRRDWVRTKYVWVYC